MKQALIYSAKVWLTTIVIGPLLAVAVTYFIAWYNPIISYSGLGFWVGAYFDFYAGLMLLPLSALFWLVTLWLIKTQIKTILAKSVLMFMAIVFCIIPFSVSGQGNRFSLISLMNTSYWLPSYLLIAVSCIWIYKLKCIKIEIKKISKIVSVIA